MCSVKYIAGDKFGSGVHPELDVRSLRLYLDHKINSFLLLIRGCSLLFWIYVQIMHLSFCLSFAVKYFTDHLYKPRGRHV